MIITEPTNSNALMPHEVTVVVRLDTALTALIERVLDGLTAPTSHAAPAPARVPLETPLGEVLEALTPYVLAQPKRPGRARILSMFRNVQWDARSEHPDVQTQAQKYLSWPLTFWLAHEGKPWGPYDERLPEHVGRQALKVLQAAIRAFVADLEERT